MAPGGGGSFDTKGYVRREERRAEVAQTAGEGSPASRDLPYLEFVQPLSWEARESWMRCDRKRSLKAGRSGG